MATYRIRNLSTDTPQTLRQKLHDKLLQIPSVRKVALHPNRREVRLTVTGAEPNAKLIRSVCDELGFFLERRVTKRL
jgi:hypothetical protein